MKNNILLILLLLSFNIKVLSQDKNALIQKGIQLENTYQYTDALKIFEVAYKNDPENITVLNHISYLLSVPSYTNLTEDEKAAFYKRSQRLAEKVISLDPKNALGYYHLALALGRLTENASIKLKIANAKLIRTTCEKAISLNPKLPGPYHILGRWHRVIAGFNGFEKAMISAFYDKGLQEGSYEEAIANFQKAINLEPDNCIHYYEMAETYHERGEKNDDVYAKVWLKKALQIPPRNDAEKLKLKMSRELLMKLDD